MKGFIIRVLAITLVIFMSACSTSSDADMDIIENYTGTFIWGGHPALDGAGLLFETGDTTYGIPGDKSDYPGLFPSNSSAVEIRTDFVITGNQTVRGWGATFPEAILIKPQRIP